MANQLEVEEWRAIPGYDGYEASSHGRVRSLDKVVRHNYGGSAIKPGRTLAQQANRKGYAMTGPSVNGKVKTTAVHRLVALAFCPEKPGATQVNHIDGDKLNNNAINLEWVTAGENIRHAWDSGLATGRTPSDANKAVTSARSARPVFQRDASGNLIREWPSTKLAAQALGVTPAAIHCAIWSGKTSANFHWTRS